MARFIYIAVLIAVGSLLYSEAQHFVSAHDTEREPCRGGSNDQWVKDPDTCEPSCYDPYASSCIYVANSVCRPALACRCINGTYRRDDGLCVSGDACPKFNNTHTNEKVECLGGPYDIFREDIKYLEADCAFPYIGYVPLYFPHRLPEQWTRSACICVDGYVRNSDGHCVPFGECPHRKLLADVTDNQKKCIGGPNDVWVDKKDAYEYSCELLLAAPVQSILHTQNGGCRCSNGTVRRRDGTCVQPSECYTPADINTCHHYQY